MRIGLIGTESDHAEEFLRMLNSEERYAGRNVTAMWGSDADRTGRLAATYGVALVVARPEAMLGEVDAVIVCDRHGDDHLPHALPFIEAGLPAFIDKPLARTVRDAEVLLLAADRSGALVTSASALRWQKATDELGAELQELGQPDRIIASGSFYPDSEYGGLIFYGIHATELALQLAGAKVTDVVVEKADPREVRLAMWAGSTEIVIRLLRPLPGEPTSFAAEIFKAGRRIGGQIVLPDDYMAPVLDRFMQMIESGRPPLGREELLMPVRLMEMAQAAFDAVRLRSDPPRA